MLLVMILCIVWPVASTNTDQATGVVRQILQELVPENGTMATGLAAQTTTEGSHQGPKLRICTVNITNA
eukprot:7223407-Karenia_brevis.AAC.1